MNPIRIHQLDNILANQIAAGEVVERPASVVKELIENSIDAGASRVDIDIEKGGAVLIRVKDDGCGIHPDDLTLSLSRHATSKISKTEDLAAINSLGFRGEALASISSVSKLNLVSKWHQAEQALKAETEGRNMDVIVTPAGLNQGTLVEVKDLFFNTPARRRFMRTDKTEFRNIETVVSRVALSHPHISFMLKHNGKKVRHFVAANNRQSEEHRVSQILGKEFIQNCVHFNLEHRVDSANIKFSGWLGLPTYHRSMNDGQFVFINDRPVKDAVVSHAIREAYSSLIPQGRLPAYIINIEMDANTVDVNVHPTKHEVRFQHQRMVHDLIIRAVAEVLNQGMIETGIKPKIVSSSIPLSAKGSEQPEEESLATHEHQGKTSSHHSFQQNGTVVSGGSTLSETAEVYAKLLQTPAENDADFDNENTWLVDDELLLLPVKKQLLLISLELWMEHYWSNIWLQQFTQSKIKFFAILFPKNYSINKKQTDIAIQKQPLLEKLGLEIFLDNDHSCCKLLTLPKFLSAIDSEQICAAIFDNLNILEENNAEKFIQEFCKNIAVNINARRSIISHYNLRKRIDAIQWLGNFQALDEIDKNNLNPSWLQIISAQNLNQIFQQQKSDA